MALCALAYMVISGLLIDVFCAVAKRVPQIRSGHAVEQLERCKP